jgi:L,D-peptidoglycan transpeptidase YkuD (ErfK/YbiS/YcfS/YnhG family)
MTGSPTSLLVVVSLAATTPSAPPPRPTAPRSTSACRAGETAVVVDTTAHRLYLCGNGAAERSFTVALGANGVDKRRAGDNRTPLGSYALGTPRASASFHRFVPVAYPTPAQSRAGFTGTAIGIHGPPRGLEDAARLRALVATDWTAGCIAVATNDDIETIVRWLDQHGVRVVRLSRAAGE